MSYDITTSYFVDGFSLYNYFGVGVESGSDDLLQFPDRKDSISHDWEDENGVDVDLTRVFLKEREATFKCFILANDETDFWNKYNLFLSYLTKPGTRRLTITEHGRDYFIYYKKSNAYKRFTRILSSNQIACKFDLTVVEPDPTSNRVETYLVTEAGSFIIT